MPSLDIERILRDLEDSQPKKKILDDQGFS
jgi:hypothetical protein